MSKELEALHTIAFNTQFIAGMNFGNELRTIEQALQRLEAIDNAKPNEALKEILNKVFDYGVQSILDNLLLRGYNTKNILEQECLGNTLEKDLDEAKAKIINLKGIGTIKQALLKTQEQEKVLDIIYEKNVDIEYIKTCFYDEKGGLKEYNSWAGDEDKQLTEEEFDLLKRRSERNKSE